MRADRFASLAILAAVAPAVARAEAQRIVPVEIVVAGDEDDAARARIEGQLSDLAVDVRVVVAGRDVFAAEGALRVTFETTEALSRRVTVVDTLRGARQTRVVELPNGPAALSAQRESVALSARRMIKAFLDEGPRAEVDPSLSEKKQDVGFAILSGASGTLAFEGSLMGLRGDVRGLARYGGWRADLGLAGVYRTFDVRGYRWSVEGLGPVALVGFERAFDATRVYVGVGASYVVGTRRAEGPSATADLGRSFVLPRLEVAYAREIGAGLSLGVNLAFESEFPRVGYQVQGLNGIETLLDSPLVEPSLGLQFGWGAPPTP